jgi:hypothetical protein
MGGSHHSALRELALDAFAARHSHPPHCRALHPVSSRSYAWQLPNLSHRTSSEPFMSAPATTQVHAPDDDGRNTQDHQDAGHGQPAHHGTGGVRSYGDQDADSDRYPAQHWPPGSIAPVTCPPHQLRIAPVANQWHLAARFKFDLLSSFGVQVSSLKPRARRRRWSRTDANFGELQPLMQPLGGCHGRFGGLPTVLALLWPRRTAALDEPGTSRMCCGSRHGRTP